MIETLRGILVDLWDVRVGRAVVMVIVGFVAIKIASAIVERWLTRREHPHRAVVAKKAVLYLGTLAVLLGAAKAARIDLSTYLAAAGVLTVAVGFAAQTSVGNLIAGIFLLIDRPFEVGDHVQIDGRDGNVESISLMSTHLRTFDNLLVRWPNETVLKSMIVNFARNPAWRLDIPFRVAHGTDLEHTRRIVCDAVFEGHDVLLDPPPAVWATRIDDHGVGLELRVWVDRGRFLEARTDVVIALHEALKRAGIELSYPQLTVSWGDRPFTSGADEAAHRSPGATRAPAGGEARRSRQLDSPVSEPDPP